MRHTGDATDKNLLALAELACFERHPSPVAVESAFQNRLTLWYTKDMSNPLLPDELWVGEQPRYLRARRSYVRLSAGPGGRVAGDRIVGRLPQPAMTITGHSSGETEDRCRARLLTILPTSQ